MKTPLLFLDIEGVLNSSNTDFGPERAPLDPVNIKPFNRIIEATEAEIVITSDWRYSLSLESIESYFEEAGILGTLVDATPNLVGYDEEDYIFHAGQLPTRGDEIQSWFTESGVTDPHQFDRRFTILDDRADMDPLTDWLVLTRIDRGLTDTEADQVIERLLVEA